MSPHSFGESQRLHAHPLFFWQTRSGAIEEIHHHPSEDKDALWNKRLLASYLQLVQGPGDVSAWGGVERDSAGEVEANYSIGRRLFSQQLLLKTIWRRLSKRSQSSWHQAHRRAFRGCNAFRLVWTRALFTVP